MPDLGNIKKSRPTNNAANISTALRDHYEEDRAIQWELAKAGKSY